MTSEAFFFMSILTTSCVSSQQYAIGVLYETTEWSSSELPTANATAYGVVTVSYSNELISGTNPFSFTEKVCDYSGSRISGLVAFASCSTATVLEWQASTLTFPLVIVSKEEYCYRPATSPGLKFLQDCSLLNSAMAGIAIHMSWRDVRVVYNDFYSNLCQEDLLTKLTAVSVWTRLLHVSTNNITNDQWSILKSSSQVVTFLLFNNDDTHQFLLQAESQGMFSRNYFWVVNIHPQFVSDKALFGSLHSGLVLTIAPNPYIDSGLSINTTDAVLMDIMTTYQHGIMSALQSDPMYTSGSYDCSHHAPNVQGDLLVQEILQNSVSGYIGTTTWDTHRFNKNVLQIHSSEKDKIQPLVQVANFTEPSNLKTTDSRLFKNLFRDFGNRTLTVVSVQSIPFQMKQFLTNDSFYYYGFCYDILDEFARAFNFRYKTVESIDGTYGGPTDDGLNGTGMVGMVMRGEADIGVGPFTVTAIRETVIDFLIPFQEEGIGIIMKKPDPNANRLFRMFLPFQYTSWISIVSAILATAVLLYTVTRLSPDTNRVHVDFSRNLWLAFGAYFGQGGESNPTSASGRVILGVWWLFTILILSLYTANLAAFLTVSLVKTPIKSVNELASQTEYKPLVKDGSNLYALFKGAKSGTYKKIWSMMSDMPVIKSTEAGYDLVNTGQYAYMTDASQLTYKVMTDCKNLEVADETFNKAGLSFIINENAPFKEEFNKHMIKMIEAGLISKFQTNWWPRNSECSSASSSTKAKELQIDSMAGLFFVYSGFIGLAVMLCFLELLIVRYLYPKYCQKRIGSTADLIKDSSTDDI